MIERSPVEKDDTSSRGSLERLVREPLVHFLALAALIFVLDASFSERRKETILVDQQTVDYLIQQREDLELRKLSPEERRATIDAFVQDELLYREAYRRGLDRGDSRMRRNLIRKMRVLLIGDVEAPTDEQLRTFFEENRERFVNPPTWSLEQVFFSDASAIPEGLLEELRQGRDPATVGETAPWLGLALRRVSQRSLVVTFGPEAARAIIAIEDDQWHGPFQSPRGVHFVRVVGREPAQESSYEGVQSFVEGEWTMAHTREVVEQEIDRLRETFDVVIEDAGDASR